MRVTLLNEGPDAYKAKDYGNRITVERRINKGGGGGYRLLSQSGTVFKCSSLSILHSLCVKI